jgi:Fe-S-cluster containining protein
MMVKQESDCRRKLIANRNSSFAINFVRTLHNQIDALAQSIRKRITFDCTRGCSHCCTLRIEVIVPEVFLIARELGKLPAAKRDELIARLTEHSRAAHGVRMEHFFLACPFLEDGACSIYEVRPTMCRKYWSLDVEQCKKPDTSAPENAEMVLKSSVLISGFTGAYGRAKLPNKSHELGQALLRALSDNTLEERWFNGHEVFEPIPEQRTP